VGEGVPPRMLGLGHCWYDRVVKVSFGVGVPRVCSNCRGQ
jgi:hypothetical protein